MRTLIAQQGQEYFWSVIPPIYSQTGLNFGKAHTRSKAEEAIERYCNAAVTKVFDDVFQKKLLPCFTTLAHHGIESDGVLSNQNPSCA
jgi:hypothetical protein